MLPKDERRRVDCFTRLQLADVSIRYDKETAS